MSKMLHPFLILPLIGGYMLGKVLMNATDGDVTRQIILLLVIIAICIAVFLFVYRYVTSKTLTRIRRREWIIRPDGHFVDIGEAERADGQDGQDGQGRQVGGIDEIFGLLGRVIPPWIRAGGAAGQGIGGDRARVVFDMLEMPVVNNAVIPVVGNDVHDTEIQKSLRSGISKLIKWYDRIDVPLSKADITSQIKKYIFDEYDGTYEEKERAYNTIRTMESTNGMLASVDRTEVQILMMVWQRIRDPVNRSVSTELKNNLIGALADANIRTTYNAYCLVGRVTRIVQALESLDAEGIVNIKTKSIIKKEIQQKIPVLVNAFFDDNGEAREAYDEGDETIAEKLQEYVRKQLEEDYTGTTVMNDHKDTIESYLEELA